MQKKLLTVAIGAALVAGTSLVQANVKVGGQAQVEYYNGKVECGVGNGAAVATFSGSGSCAAGDRRLEKASGLIDNARGRFFIAADEDITGSLKALARYEFSVDVANSGQTTGNGNTASPYDGTARTFDQRTREKYVGLQGGFGTLTIGNLHGVYKRLGGVRWDTFNATVLEARGNGGQSGGGDSNSQFAHNGFIPGAIKWESDKLMGPARLEVLVAPDSNTSSSTFEDSGNGYDYQLGLSIKPVKQLEIILAHSNNKEQVSSATHDDAKQTKLGVRGMFGGSTAFVQYEVGDHNSTGGATTSAGLITTPDATSATWLLLGFSQKFGSSEVAVQLGRHDRDGTGAAAAGGTNADYYAAGYLYNFSKTAKLWVGARKTNAESGVAEKETTIYSSGLRKDF